MKRLLEMQRVDGVVSRSERPYARII